MRPMKVLAAALAAVSLGAGVLATTAAPARADPGAVIAGAIGGIAVGALLAGAASAQPGYAYPPAYGAYPSGDEGYAAPFAAAPGYAAVDDDEPEFQSQCIVRRFPVRGQWGEVVAWRPQRVCR